MTSGCSQATFFARDDCRPPIPARPLHRTCVGRASLSNHVSCICLISRRLRTVVRAFLDIQKPRHRFQLLPGARQHCHSFATNLQTNTDQQVSRAGCWTGQSAAENRRLGHPKSCYNHAINCLASHLQSINARILTVCQAGRQAVSPAKRHSRKRG
jgi:hypothetical protein